MSGCWVLPGSPESQRRCRIQQHRGTYGGVDCLPSLRRDAFGDGGNGEDVFKLGEGPKVEGDPGFHLSPPKTLVAVTVESS